MREERQRLEGALQTWAETRGRTYLLLHHLNDDELRAALPRPALDTFVKQLEEMVQVQKAFTNALVSGECDFSTIPSQFSGESTKGELERDLKAADKELEAAVEACSEGKVIDMYGLEWTPVDVIQGLIRHEIFHHGQITAYAFLLKVPLPERWFALVPSYKNPIVPRLLKWMAE